MASVRTCLIISGILSEPFRAFNQEREGHRQPGSRRRHDTVCSVPCAPPLGFCFTQGQFEHTVGSEFALTGCAAPCTTRPSRSPQRQPSACAAGLHSRTLPSTLTPACPRLRIWSPSRFVLSAMYLCGTFFTMPLIAQLIERLFPTSDFEHPVTTPAMLLMGRYLSHSALQRPRDVVAGDIPVCAHWLLGSTW
jgi:hypothetical protein